MIFDGITGGHEVAHRFVDARAQAIVAEQIALEPVQPVVPLDDVAPSHALPHPINLVHRFLFFPSLRAPGPAYCRAVSSARFDGALRFTGVAESTATTA